MHSVTAMRPVAAGSTTFIVGPRVFRFADAPAQTECNVSYRAFRRECLVPARTPFSAELRNTAVAISSPMLSNTPKTPLNFANSELADTTVTVLTPESLIKPVISVCPIMYSEPGAEINCSASGPLMTRNVLPILVRKEANTEPRTLAVSPTADLQGAANSPHSPIGAKPLNKAMGEVARSPLGLSLVQPVAHSPL